MRTQQRPQRLQPTHTVFVEHVKGENGWEEFSRTNDLGKVSPAMAWYFGHMMREGADFVFIGDVMLTIETVKGDG